MVVERSKIKHTGGKFRAKLVKREGYREWVGGAELGGGVSPTGGTVLGSRQANIAYVTIEKQKPNAIEHSAL